MNHKILVTLSVLAVILLVAARAFQPQPVEIPVTQREVKDQGSLLEALKNKSVEIEGAKVELGDTVEQSFFSVKGQVIKVNNSDVQAFEYATPDAMESEAVLVSADGGSVGTNMVMWMATPHFFKAGRMIVLYVGDDAAVLDLLQGALGKQFAGR